MIATATTAASFFIASPTRTQKTWSASSATDWSLPAQAQESVQAVPLAMALLLAESRMESRPLPECARNRELGTLEPPLRPLLQLVCT